MTYDSSDNAQRSYDLAIATMRVQHRARRLGDIGLRLRLLREQRGITLRAAAAATGDLISYSLLNKVECGMVEPGFLKVAALADLYGVPLALIADGDRP